MPACHCTAVAFHKAWGCGSHRIRWTWTPVDLSHLHSGIQFRRPFVKIRPEKGKYVTGEGGAVADGDGGVGEIVLFGVRVKVDPMRKSVSMSNLSEYEPRNNNTNPNSGATGYASADDVVAQPSGGSRELKRGIPWTEEEHRLFLIGLQKIGKGDWRGISRNYVKTRTPTQVASHAQKHFLRRSNINHRRGRSSLFDITTETVAAMPVEDNESRTPIQVPLPVAPNVDGFAVVPFPVAIIPATFSMQGVDPMEVSAPSQNDAANASSAMLVCTVAAIPVSTSSSMMDLNLEHQVPTEQLPLSLSLSLSSGRDQPSAIKSRFQMIRNFKTGDSMITVA